MDLVPCTGPWGYSKLAIFDYARGGPQFGAADLVIGPPLTPTAGGIAGPDIAAIDPAVEKRLWETDRPARRRQCVSRWHRVAARASGGGRRGGPRGGRKGRVVALLESER